MLHHEDTDVLFPPRVIKTLRDLRGDQWRQLIEQLMEKDETHPDVLAFSLMIIRHNSCLTCQPHSFRAMRGCAVCTQHTIRRFKGNDQELIDHWEKAREEIQRWLENNRGATTR